MPGSGLDIKVQRHVFCPLVEGQTGDPPINSVLQTQYKLTEAGTRHGTVEYYYLLAGSWLGK